MIKSPQLLQELNRRYERKALADLSYEAALQRFSALWEEACELGDVARVLNGLP